MTKKIYLLALFIFFAFAGHAQALKIGLLKYNGGGDWYANPTALPNLARFCNQNLNMNINPEYSEIDPSGTDIYNVHFIHMTSHGNVIFNSKEQQKLREYLFSGGFLHIDDNYGLDKYIRRELKKLFPQKKLVELPFDHPIYHQTYDFDKGLPKIHRHDGKAPRGYGILHEGRVIVFYSHESDLGDGWEDPSVHNDSPEKHREALKMGANILQYASHH